MRCKYFEINELVPQHVYKDRGEKAWELIDDKLILVLDRLRENLGRGITVNNYKWGGDFEQRGLRTPDCLVYSKYSQHSFGRAVDFHVNGLKAWEVRKFICENIQDYPEITFVEVGHDMNWVHIDVRNSDILRFWDKNTKLYVSQEDVVKNKL